MSNSMSAALLEQLHDALLGYGSLWTAIAMIVGSVALPLIIIIGKLATKHLRRMRAEAFLSLEAMFKPGADDAPPDALMQPIFEPLRTKYLGRSREEDNNAPRRHWLDHTLGWLMPTMLYGLSMLLFAIIVAFCTNQLFLNRLAMIGPGCGPSLTACLPNSSQMLLLGLRQPSNLANDLAYLQITTVMLGYAFVGAYLWSVFYLIRRVNNYDLTPYSFVLCGIRIVLALAIALVIRHTIFTDAILVAEADSSLASYLGVLVAFVLGFYPMAGMDWIVRRAQQFTIKRIHPQVADLRHTYPLDVIDGITDFVQFRLEELEYEDVQNLATANPVLLGTETSYEFLEIIDWIAQAQLIIAVGPEKVVELRKMNVRSIFDLARIGDANHIRRCVLSTLIGPEGFRASLSDMSDDDIQATFASVFAGIASNLHVFRLARLWNAYYALLRGGADDIATRGLLTRRQPPANWMEAALTMSLATTPPKAAE